MSWLFGQIWLWVLISCVLGFVVTLGYLMGGRAGGAAARKAEVDRRKTERREAAERKQAERREAAERQEAERREAAERKEAERREAAERKEAERRGAAEREEAERRGAAEREKAAAVAASVSTRPTNEDPQEVDAFATRSRSRRRAQSYDAEPPDVQVEPYDPDFSSLR